MIKIKAKLAGQPLMQLASLSGRHRALLLSGNTAPQSCGRLKALEAAVVAAANAAYVARSAYRAAPSSEHLKDALDAARSAESRSVQDFYEHTWMHGCTE
jgi:hypothetical protein